MTKNVKLQQHIKEEKRRLKELQDYPGVYGDDIQKEVRKQIAKLNDDL